MPDPMPRDIVFTPNAAKPPATYSQAVKAAGLVFVSGTAPADPATGKLVGTTIQEQVRHRSPTSPPSSKRRAARWTAS